MTPYYQDDLVTIYHGDARNVADAIAIDPAVLVMDPPYGIAYSSGHAGKLRRSIQGDDSTVLRDWALERWPVPALVFGTWRITRPSQTRMLLVWDTGGALGMGDLSLPWKPAHQEVYVIGSGFTGRRTSDVLLCPPVQSSAWRGRVHPHEKPVPLLRELISKCPPGLILDPFMGSGSTLVAAKSLGRTAVGIEIDGDDCAEAARRCSQEVLGLPA